MGQGNTERPLLPGFCRSVAMTLLGLLVAVIVICLVFWCVQQLTAAFGVPNQVRVVSLVLPVVAVILWLLGGSGVLNAPIRLR